MYLSKVGACQTARHAYEHALRVSGGAGRELGRLDYAPKSAQEESGHSPHHEECSGYTTMARSRGCTLSLLIPAWVKGDQRPYGEPVVSKLGHARGREGASSRRSRRRGSQSPSPSATRNVSARTLQVYAGKLDFQFNDTKLVWEADQRQTGESSRSCGMSPRSSRA
ncbi:unnamed protein product [Sphagnum troendelagicum]|uniref:Uncharacterized protein n=1 Tax=Sphagnum troendelagicum TaxID=128251 RepID=A0ABP0T8M0_9BRYO